jgi:hypothetical protein
VNRLLAPSLNPAGLSGTIAALYAAGLMISHVISHQAAFSLPVTVAAVSAVLSFLTRQAVTPVADPKDGAGRPLVPAESEPVKQAS